jgi:hypothetical protein
VKKVSIIYVVSFLLLIFAVPVSQVVYEAKKGQRIQCLDLFEDTFITPVKRIERMHRLLLSVAQRLDSTAAELALSPAGSTRWDSQRAQALIDEAMVDAAELHKTAATYNRHVLVNPESKSLKEIAAYTRSLDTLLTATRSGVRDEAAAILASVKQATARLSRTYRAPVGLDASMLVLQNLPVIFWKATYLRPFEKELENTSIYTIASRPLMFFIRYALFNDLGEKGVLGKNSWFFYKQDVDYLIRPYVRDKRAIVVDPNDKVVSDNPIQAAVTFKKQLSEFGVDLLVVIIPTKPSIYPEMLAPGADAQSVCIRGNSLRAIADLRAAGVEAVDLFAPFLAEKKNDARAGDSMYLSKDTHWRSRGARTAARVVADRIKQYPWYQAGAVEYILDSLSVDRVGDVGTMTTLPSVTVRELALNFPVEKTLCYQVFQVERDENGTETGRRLYKDDFRDAQVLLLGDSYSRIYQTDQPRSAGWISHIAFELRQPIASLVSDGGASTLVRQSLARKPRLLKGKKLVVWEVVERDLRYGGEGWKDVALSMTAE